MNHTVEHLEGQQAVLVQAHTEQGDLLFEGLTDVSSWDDDTISEMVEYLAVADTDRMVYGPESSRRFFSYTRLYH